MKTGKFISLEGGEGAGKTTQATRIKSALEAANIEVVITREPGGTFGAEAIRDLVLGGSHERWSGLTELLLMYAARLDHVEKLIKPALARGVWVLCDRFSDSSMAYQGYARGLGREKVAAIDEVVLGGFKPDLTILFDIDPILAQRRVKARGEDLSRFDTEDLDFHKTLRAAFLDIAKRNTERFGIVDATLSRDAIEAQIKHLLMQKFSGLRLG
ncbi:MAG: dTMP kinase [Robiginitomaculum sp.]|nr:MAG: dTMP kinase [Robiginitomaculum sp.]